MATYCDGQFRSQRSGTRCRRCAAKTTVRTDLLLLLTPVLGRDPCLLEGAEDLAVEQFVLKSTTEAIAVAAFP